MSIPQLFQDSAFPALDEELSNLLVPYIGQGDRAIIVTIKVRDPVEHFDMQVLYLFIKRKRRVWGVWLKTFPHVRDKMIDMGQQFAAFYAGKDIRVEKLEHTHKPG